jgi:hypothetical protein
MKYFQKRDIKRIDSEINRKPLTVLLPIFIARLLPR